MSKKKVVIFVLVVVAIVFLSLTVKNSLQKKKEQTSPEGTDSLLVSATPSDNDRYTPPSKEEVKIKNEWIILRDLENVTLHSNLDEKLSSKEAIRQNACIDFVSAGFYTKEGTHIGLFKNSGGYIADPTNNAFYNGFLYIKDNKAYISNSYDESARLILQSGPLLVQDAVAQKVSAANDKPARRIVAAITQKEELVFIVIYDKYSVYSGPYLSKVPEILTQITNETSVNVKEALNLDGGTASAFYNEFFKLPEAQTIGGYFCIK